MLNNKRRKNRKNNTDEEHTEQVEPDEHINSSKDLNENIKDNSPREEETRQEEQIDNVDKIEQEFFINDTFTSQTEIAKPLEEFVPTYDLKTKHHYEDCDQKQENNMNSKIIEIKPIITSTINKENVIKPISNKEVNLKTEESVEKENIKRLEKIENEEKNKIPVNYPQENLITSATEDEKILSKKQERIENEKGPQKEKDEISDHSKSSSINDFFTFTREYNAKRIQTQIAEMQIDAAAYTKSLIRLSRNFNKIIKKLNNTQNTIFNYLFSVFGYTYKTNINKANLFVFTVQAWLIDLCSQLDSKLKSVSEKEGKDGCFKFSDILRIIKENEQKEGVTPSRELSYLNNLGIFTGNLLLDRHNSSSFTLIENNIGKNFIHSLSIVIQNELNLDTEEADKKGFEDILMHLIKKGVEKTLNIEMQSEDEVDFTEVYDQFILSDLKDQKEKLTFENYFLKVKEDYIHKIKKNLNAFELNEMKICCETFFDFAQNSFEEILNDIKLFIKNYSSIMFKIKRFISQSYNKYKDFSLGLVQKTEILYTNFFYTISNLTGKDKIIETTKHVGKYVIKNMAKVVIKGDRGLNRLKHWIEDSFDRVKPIYVFYEIFAVLYKGINFTYEKSIYATKFIIHEFEVGYQKYDDIKNKVTGLIRGILNKSYVLIGDNLTKLSRFILIKEDKQGRRFSILIKKDLMIINPERFAQVYNLILNILKNSYKFTSEQITGIKNSAEDNSIKIKNYVMAKYQRFLGAEDVTKQQNKLSKIEMTTLIK